MSGGASVIFDLWGIPFVGVGLYMVFGRFFYKRYRKSRTVYGITTQRAMILGPRSFTFMPLGNQSVTIKRARDFSHASIIVGDAMPERRRNRRKTPTFYANTGMELLSRRGDLPFAFYDVADPDAMLAALGTGSLSPRLTHSFGRTARRTLRTLRRARPEPRYYAPASASVNALRRSPSGRVQPSSARYSSTGHVTSRPNRDR